MRGKRSDQPPLPLSGCQGGRQSFAPPTCLARQFVLLWDSAGGNPGQDQRAATALRQCDRAGGVMLARFALVSTATMTWPAIASEPVFLHAAGSLRGRTDRGGRRVRGRVGPARAGQLRSFRHIEGRDRGRCARRGVRLRQHGAPHALARLIGLWWLCKILYPDLFPEDLRELTREFYARYYHVTPDAAQIDRVLAGRD